MQIKTFISHKQEDSKQAEEVGRRLLIKHSIDSYLDVLDEGVADGPALADYLRGKLRDCNNLLAVVSEATKGSWWVPWEIGVASERDYPLATVALAEVSLPTYLKKWPYLRTHHELDQYAITLNEKVGYLTEASFEQRDQRKAASKNFYSSLSRRLGRQLGT